MQKKMLIINGGYVACYIKAGKAVPIIIGQVCVSVVTGTPSTIVGAVLSRQIYSADDIGRLFKYEGPEVTWVHNAHLSERDKKAYDEQRKGA